MESSKLLKRALWANVVFAEAGALAAFFLSGKWAAVDQLTDGQGTACGIELLVLAGIATYAVLRPALTRWLVPLVIALNGLLLVFLLSRLGDASLSAAGLELVIIEAVAVGGLLVALVLGYRASSQPSNLKPAA